jgi:hypothetical protein
MTDAEIVELARVTLAMDRSPDDETLTQCLECGLSRLDPHIDPILLMLSVRLLEGKPYGIASDNSETIRRCRLLAAHLGATVTAADEGDVMTSLRFDPATRN